MPGLAGSPHRLSEATARHVALGVDRQGLRSREPRERFPATRTTASHGTPIRFPGSNAGIGSRLSRACRADLARPTGDGIKKEVTSATVDGFSDRRPDRNLPGGCFANWPVAWNSAVVAVRVVGFPPCVNPGAIGDAVPVPAARPPRMLCTPASFARGGLPRTAGRSGSVLRARKPDRRRATRGGVARDKIQSSLAGGAAIMPWLSSTRRGDGG